jgi:hypothetical protein
MKTANKYIEEVLLSKYIDHADKNIVIQEAILAALVDIGNAIEDGQNDIARHRARERRKSA